MDKYSGCNIVESVVTPVKRERARKERKFGGIILRIAVAAVIIGVILAVHYVNAPWLDVVRDALRSVFCYDAFGREVGGSVFFG